MDAKLQAVLDKVTKLRTLAGRATTQAEADAAAGQADALLRKYQLTEADVEAADPTKAEEIAEPEEPLHVCGQRLDRWRARLAAVLCDHYGCSSYARGGAIHIAGRASDVAILRYMFAWLAAEVTRLGAAERGKTARNMFRHGAITSLKNALRVAAKVATEEHATTHGATGSAMVLASRAQQAEAWLDSTHMFRKARAAPSFGKTDAEAYRRGLDAGRGINIGRDDRAMSGGSRSLPERAG